MNSPDMNILFAQWAPTLIGGVFVFMFGACVGSFLNVLVWRLPTGQSVVTPPSRCPICGHKLGWRENLPILGWFILRGAARRASSTSASNTQRWSSWWRRCFW